MQRGGRESRAVQCGQGGYSDSIHPRSKSAGREGLLFQRPNSLALCLEKVKTGKTCQKDNDLKVQRLEFSLVNQPMLTGASYVPATTLDAGRSDTEVQAVPGGAHVGSNRVWGQTRWQRDRVWDSSRGTV